MAITAITKAQIWFGGCDISGFTNTLALDAMAEPRESTNFASGGSKTWIGALKEASWNFSGFMPNEAEPGAILYNASAGTVLAATTNNPVPVIATLTNPAVRGDVAFGMNCMRTQIT